MPRARQTCTECSMRRQKCDRKQPCGRCVKRGAAASCTREWPGDYDPTVHRIYPGPTTSNSLSSTEESGALSSPAAKSPSVLTQRLLRRMSGRLLERQHPPTNANGPAHDTVDDAEPTERPGHTTCPRVLSLCDPPTPETGEVEDAATVLEFLAWGRSKVSDYVPKASELLWETPNPARVPENAPTWTAANNFGCGQAAPLAFLRLLLPNSKQIMQLADYYERALLWYQGSYHGPTFRMELENALRTDDKTLRIEALDLQWVALLFAIMAGSIMCTSEQTASSWGFKKLERSTLSKQWYKATVLCLHLAEYMSHHHVYSVEAILVLSMSAHTLGFSNEQSVLLGAALRIAQILGFHRLAAVDSDSIPPSSTDLDCPGVRALVSRETGRRLWSQLCVHDWFSIPFAETYSINQMHFTTVKPINRNQQMAPVPDSEPTYLSFSNYVYDIACLMPQLQDALATSNTPFTKYEQVLSYDAKMRSLATDSIPLFFSPHETIQPSWPHFIPRARRSLNVCFAHKIMMMHRAFLGKSFTNPAFGFTRRTCIAAAKTILKELRQVGEEEPFFWIDQACMVAAGITLALDLLHREPDEMEFEAHRMSVELAIEMLRKFDASMIAIRGVKLLSALLAERASLTAEQNLSEPLSGQRGKRTPPEKNGDAMEKRRRVDVPSLARSVYGDTLNENTQWAYQGPNRVDVEDTTPASPADKHSPDLRYEAFAELFPPHTGFGNAFLFEDLLNFGLI